MNFCGSAALAFPTGDEENLIRIIFDEWPPKSMDGM